LTIEDSKIGISATPRFEAGFGVILEENADEELVIVGTACEGVGFVNCSNVEAKLQLNYRLVGEEFQDDPINITIASTDKGESPVGEIQAAFNDTGLSELVTVQEQGTAVILLRFDSSVAEVDLRIPKHCANAETDVIDSTVFPNNDTFVFKCADDEKNKAIDSKNPYKFADESKAKRPFQFGVSQVSLELADISGVVEATVSANVGGVIEVKADLDAAITGSISATVGPEEMIPFSDWLIGLVNMFQNSTT
jgi:DNA-binding transcriptional regulator YdaS (Cro superfamily)